MGGLLPASPTGARRRALYATTTLVGQRVVGIALGYEDLNDHDDLRHDPVMAVLAGKLKARRKRCAPVAGSRRYLMVPVALNALSDKC